MSKGRGNPVQSLISRKVLSQSVANPVASNENTDKGNPAKMRGGVKQNPSKTLNQKVGNPSDGFAQASKPIPGLAGKRGK
jgi:hypothetical protein